MKNSNSLVIIAVLSLYSTHHVGAQWVSEPHCKKLDESKGYWCPVVRYCPWSHYSDSARAVLENDLTYTVDGWDFLYAETVDAWGNLTRTQKGILEEMEYNSFKYDCCLNHYNGYDWSEFSSDYYTYLDDVKATWELLGYNETLWEEGPTPEIANSYWDDIPEEIRDKLVSEVCYTRETWNLVPLTNSIWEAAAVYPGEYDCSVTGETAYYGCYAEASESPSKSPLKIPSKSPLKIPIESPSKSPIESPIESPSDDGEIVGEKLNIVIPIEATVGDITKEDVTNEFLKAMEATVAAEANSDAADVTNWEEVVERKSSIMFTINLIKDVSCDGDCDAALTIAEAVAASMKDDLQESVTSGKFLTALKETSDLAVMESISFADNSFVFSEPVIAETTPMYYLSEFIGNLLSADFSGAIKNLLLFFLELTYFFN